MENLEQKSKSDDMIELGEDGTPKSQDQIQAEEEKRSAEDEAVQKEILIEPLPQEYRATIPFSRDEINPLMEEYWKTHEEILLKRFPVKAKKRKGGKSLKGRKLLEDTIPAEKLYAEVFANYAVSKLDDVFFLKGIHIPHIDGNCGTVLAFFFKNPRLDIYQDFELNHEIEHEPWPTADSQWEVRLRDAQNKGRTIKDSEDEEVKEYHEVLMDVIASHEGSPLDEGTFRREWREWKTLVAPMKELLLGRKKGELFETSFVMPDHIEGMGGKKVDAHIKIYELRDIEYPQVDNELAKDEGFDNLDAFREQFDKEYAAYIQDAKRGLAVDHYINQIRSLAKIPMVPADWVNAQVEGLLTQNLQRFNNSESRMCMAFGAKSLDQVRHMMKGRVFDDLLSKLAVETYTRIFNLENPEVEAVFNDMVDRVIWKEKADEKEAVE